MYRYQFLLQWPHLCPRLQTNNFCIKQLRADPEVLQSVCCHLLQGNLLLRGVVSKNSPSSNGPIEFRSPNWHLLLKARTSGGWGSEYIIVHILKIDSIYWQMTARQYVSVHTVKIETIFWRMTACQYVSVHTVEIDKICWHMRACQYVSVHTVKIDTIYWQMTAFQHVSVHTVKSDTIYWQMTAFQHVTVYTVKIDTICWQTTACQYIVAHIVMSDKLSSTTEQLSVDIWCSRILIIIIIIIFIYCNWVVTRWQWLFYM